MGVRTVMAVGAHPDDIEILCAGTLAKYANQGSRVVMACITNGNMGHAVIPPAELAQIREKEMRESAKVIGAEVVWLGFPDEKVFDDQDTRLKVVDALRVGRPDILITHSPSDYHPDHRMASKLVFDASFLCTVPHIETEHPFHTKVAPILYMDTLAGLEFQPEMYVDVTETFETKRKMLSKHQSQVRWLKEHDKIDILEFIEVVARFRGLQCNAKYAEGFTRLKAWPRMAPESLLP